MRRLLHIALLLTCFACAGNQPPRPPSSGAWDYSVSISDPYGQLLGGAHVTFGPTKKDANDFGWAYFTVPTGCYDLAVEQPGFVRYASLGCVPVDRHLRQAVILTPDTPPTTRLATSGPIFLRDGQPWRWKGVTAFKLQHRYCQGEDIQPFLDAFHGFNLLRVFLYVEWDGTGWPQASDECIHGFLNYVAARGWYVEETLLTGTKPIPEAQQIVDHFFSTFASHTNLLVELVNEPHVYDKPDTSQLHVPADTPILWASGDYDPPSKMRGRYGVAHTPRDYEWPRKAHDLLEYYHGGGPTAPDDPPHAFPVVADEPTRPDLAAYVAADFEGYFGATSLLGGGGTFHFESGKYANPPTAPESVCAAAALRALDFYPADAPKGPYSRIDEQGATLRTYQVGPYVVRVRPLSGFILVPY